MGHNKGDIRTENMFLLRGVLYYVISMKDSEPYKAYNESMVTYRSESKPTKRAAPHRSPTELMAGNII